MKRDIIITSGRSLLGRLQVVLLFHLGLAEDGVEYFIGTS